MLTLIALPISVLSATLSFLAWRRDGHPVMLGFAVANTVCAVLLIGCVIALFRGAA